MKLNENLNCFVQTQHIDISLFEIIMNGLTQHPFIFYKLIIFKGYVLFLLASNTPFLIFLMNINQIIQNEAQ